MKERALSLNERLEQSSSSFDDRNSVLQIGHKFYKSTRSLYDLLSVKNESAVIGHEKFIGMLRDFLFNGNTFLWSDFYSINKKSLITLDHQSLDSIYKLNASSVKLLKIESYPYWSQIEMSTPFQILDSEITLTSSSNASDKNNPETIPAFSYLIYLHSGHWCLDNNEEIAFYEDNLNLNNGFNIFNKEDYYIIKHATKFNSQNGQTYDRHIPPSVCTKEEICELYDLLVFERTRLAFAQEAKYLEQIIKDEQLEENFSVNYSTKHHLKKYTQARLLGYTEQLTEITSRIKVHNNLHLLKDRNLPSL